MSEAKYTSYRNNKFGFLPFCPGCGHTVLVNALDKALIRLQLDPKKIVIVTDIGCIGLADRYFSTNAFHGLHGRSITYGCGLKLARPDLNVIVLQGDGGCGIGGAHLLNVSRRNIGIKLLVANNLNYGMTGGQHSVTTPAGGKTSTTPLGNLEAPMDLCATATAAGAPWVYRGTVFDQDLSEVIARAISQPGFAMLDIWELCTAYYSPRNKLKRQDLFDIIDRNHFKRGLIADNPRPEFSVLYHEQSQNNRELLKTKPTIKTKFTHTLNEKKGFIISGSAGQKIRSAATMFALASMYSGLEVTQKDDYPITVMTGHSTSELVISPEPINYNAIESPNYILLISEEGLKVSRSRIEKLPENCKLLADSSLELPETKASVFTFPFLKTARKINRFSVGIVALAVLIRYSEIFPLEALEKAITTHQSPQIADINIQALEAGAKLY
jgi:pyruvate/2-oxoacid:ferredoxin oxidoreductase beta subunit/Pyruvate/2-oxoacid:ferredoxin oxidoreductase gamma subunit